MTDTLPPDGPRCRKHHSGGSVELQPEGMTNSAVIAGADPARREKILGAAGGILEEMSVITNRIRIRQLETILTETRSAPAI